MEYSNEIIIDAPRKKIVEILVNPEMMKKWSPSLKTIELIEGNLLTVGAKSKLIFETDSEPMVMIETILDIKLPGIYNCLYESDGVKNWSHNVFSEITQNKTKWKAFNKFEFIVDISDREDKIIENFSAQTISDMKEFKLYIEKIG